MKVDVDIIRSKLNRTIAHHLAFMVNWAKGKKGSIGTGLFAEVEGRRIVATAQHVIEDAGPDQIYINLGLDLRTDAIPKSTSCWNLIRRTAC